MLLFVQLSRFQKAMSKNIAEYIHYFLDALDESIMLKYEHEFHYASAVRDLENVAEQEDTLLYNVRKIY